MTFWLDWPKHSFPWRGKKQVAGPSFAVLAPIWLLMNWRVNNVSNLVWIKWNCLHLYVLIRLFSTGSWFEEWGNPYMTSLWRLYYFVILDGNTYARFIFAIACISGNHYFMFSNSLASEAISSTQWLYNEWSNNVLNTISKFLLHLLDTM